MNKTRKVAFAAALMVAATAMAMDNGTITGGSDTKQLLGGTIYTVSGNASISVGAGKNALQVVGNNGAGGNKVVINIPENCSHSYPR